MTDRNQDLVICKLDRAKQALAEAKTLQQTKQILDKARALEIYARRQRLSADAIAYAYAIKIEALRQLGHMLMGMPKNKGTLRRGSRTAPRDLTPILADLGVNKKVSMLAQQLAKLSCEQFQQIVAGTVPMATALRAAQRAQSGNTNPPAWSPEAAKQRLRLAINSEIEWSGSNRLVIELLRRLTDEYEEADNQELRDAVSIARDELDIRDSEPGGFRIFEDEHQAATHAGAPTVIASCKSTYPQFYKDLTTKQDGITPLKRKQVDARIADIEIGKLPTKRTAHTHFAVMNAIKDFARTSSLGRGGL